MYRVRLEEPASVLLSTFLNFSNPYLETNEVSQSFFLRELPYPVYSSPHFVDQSASI